MELAIFSFMDRLPVVFKKLCIFFAILSVISSGIHVLTFNVFKCEGKTPENSFMFLFISVVASMTFGTLYLIFNDL